MREGVFECFCGDVGHGGSSVTVDYDNKDAREATVKLVTALSQLKCMHAFPVEDTAFFLKFLS